MKSQNNYIEKNKISWNNRTEYHVKSAFYDVKGFMEGRNMLNEIELNLLGDLKGKSILHLQCHFGLDTLSMARMGASVTGVDFSEKAIDQANEIADKIKADARFICCDLYELPQHLKRTFDIVFTSYGTVGWLPDMEKWAAIVHQFLKPGGQFIFADFHPVVWMYDSAFTKVEYNYFNDGPIYETIAGTYADKNAPIADETISWNHSMSEVINSLIRKGMEIKEIEEFDYAPYNCFQDMTEDEPGKFRIKHLGNKIPFVYAIHAIKK